MELIRSAAECSAKAAEWRDQGLTIGLVPTMGAFHEGHRSLMQRARHECDRVIVYLFVNPLQFVQGEDFERYPRDERADAAVAEAEDVEVLFLPAVEDMYPSGYPPPADTLVEAGPIGDILEGAARPGHFRGVLTVVDRLFTIVGACRAYFGEKDAQQLFLVTQMAADRHPEVTIVPSRTVRAPDGLALSSRNAYLDDAQRAAATVLSRALAGMAALVTAGERDPATLIEAARSVVALEPSVELESIDIVDNATFEPATGTLEQGGDYRTLIAARVGPARLIDNRTFRVSVARRCGSGRCR